MLTNENINDIEDLFSDVLFELNNEDTREAIKLKVAKYLVEKNVDLIIMCNEINNPPEVVDANVVYLHLITDTKTVYTFKLSAVSHDAKAILQSV